MKRVVRSLLLFFTTTLFMLSATVCVCVVPVYADSSYYVVRPDSSFYLTAVSNSTSLSRVFSQYSYTDDVYVFLVRYDTNDVLNFGNGAAIVSVSYSPYSFRLDDNGTILTMNGTQHGNVYYSAISYDNSVGSNLYSFRSNITEFGTYSTLSSGINACISFFMESNITYGLVDVKGYQTNIAGQGQAAIHNVDVISWDNSIDTEGNDITDGNVRIRFIPGEYRSNNKNDLLSQTYNDFILDIQNATTGNVFPVTDGSASFMWQDVMDTLNFSSMDVFNTVHDYDMWLKRGWIYEIRLEIDDYIGEWQSIYSSTSSGVENDLTIVNTSVITQNTITAIQQINSINNTTNIWIVNGQPVDPNPEQEEPETENEKPWWVYLLEMINNTLGIQNEYINEGTDESIEVVNNFEDDHTELNTTVNDYDDIENDLVLDMNNNLEQIEVESDLIENNSFLSSASWVAEQYTRITTDNPIGSILKFSLVLGFVMIFLGRFRQ